jgi:hypothetical protein
MSNMASPFIEDAKTSHGQDGKGLFQLTRVVAMSNGKVGTTFPAIAQRAPNDPAMAPFPVHHFWQRPYAAARVAGPVRPLSKRETDETECGLALHF